MFFNSEIDGVIEGSVTLVSEIINTSNTVLFLDGTSKDELIFDTPNWTVRFFKSYNKDRGGIYRVHTDGKNILYVHEDIKIKEK